MKVYYAGEVIGERRVDFLVKSKIAVELKALIKPEHVYMAQTKNYLEAYNPEVGLLINHGAIIPEFTGIENPEY